jgi:hypothetical protein
MVTKIPTALIGNSINHYQNSIVALQQKMQKTHNSNGNYIFLQA